MTRSFALCRRLSLLAVVGLLSACIPAPKGKYYKPLYPDAAAKYSGDLCYGQAGAAASLSFVIADGVTLGVTTRPPRDEVGRQLLLSMSIPTGTRIQFQSTEIRIADGTPDQERRISPDMAVSAAVRMDSNALVDFSAISPSTSNNQAREFSAATWFAYAWKDDFVPAAFTMTFPAIVFPDDPGADRQPLILQATAKRRSDRYPGEFKSQTSLIYPTPESESALAAKYEKCVRERPETRCQNILDYDDAVFKVDKQGVRYSGRWYVYHVEKHTPFSGDIKLEFDAPQRWRFASNQIRLSEGATRTEKVYQFDHFPLHFSYRIPLDTPLRGVNNVAGNSLTTLRIQSDLGRDEAARYRIKLPTLLINGKPYDIAPIELEKRMFDVGLEPFNC